MEGSRQEPKEMIVNGNTTHMPRVVEGDISSIGYKEPKLSVVEGLFRKNYKDFYFINYNTGSGAYVVGAKTRLTGEPRVIKAQLTPTFRTEEERQALFEQFVYESWLTRDFSMLLPGKVTKVTETGIKDIESRKITAKFKNIFYNDVPFFVMKYVGDNAESIKNGNFKELEMKGRIGADVAETVALLHYYGFVYRDLKPENILLEGGEDMKPILGDFGTTIPMGEINKQAGRIAGTKLYISPMQAVASKKRPLTEEEMVGIDMHSFGHTLYEIVTGKHARAEYVDVDMKTFLKFLIATLTHDIELPSTGHSGLDDVIHRCLTNGKDKFTSMGQVANSLNEKFRKNPTFFLVAKGQ